MTRINLIPIDELERDFIRGEYKEIVRIFNLVKNAQRKGKTPEDIDIPKQYKLGTGHVKFFYNKLLFIVERYESLSDTMLSFGYKVNPINRKDLLEGIDNHWINGYTPSEEEIEISRQRIIERRKELGLT